MAGQAHHVRGALSALTCHLRGQNVPEPVIATTEIVLAEVLNNVVEHALSGGADGQIDLRCRRAGSGLCFEIRDDGRAMPGGTLPEGHLPPVGDRVADLPEGGWGWGLVRRLAQDPSYHRADGRNHMRFRIALPE
ncbi:ATP-binding protein [Salinihabitans flavidus]|nr:ATP-binding protein [Salinihabitans flavidus]